MLLLVADVLNEKQKFHGRHGIQLSPSRFNPTFARFPAVVE